ETAPMRSRPVDHAAGPRRPNPARASRFRAVRQWCGDRHHPPHRRPRRRRGLHRPRRGGAAGARRAPRLPLLPGGEGRRRPGAVDRGDRVGGRRLLPPGAERLRGQDGRGPAARHGRRRAHRLRDRVGPHARARLKRSHGPPGRRIVVGAPGAGRRPPRAAGTRPVPGAARAPGWARSLFNDRESPKSDPPTASRMESLREMAAKSEAMDKLVNLAKRRGLVYPSSEIYGGLRASWDYGPLGVELKQNIKRQWWRAMVQEREDIVGLDSSVILAREVWEASGHVQAFVDPLTECQSCHKRFRADHLIEAYEEKHGKEPAGGLADLACPNCGAKHSFTEPKMFNGLLRTHLGPVQDEAGLAFLRPETAQGIFINYLNVQQSARRKIPFGIGQIGKSFRNEIT